MPSPTTIPTDEERPEVEAPLGFAPFLLWGLTTVWIYTIVKFGRVMASHFAKRRARFEARFAATGVRPAGLDAAFAWNGRPLQAFAAAAGLAAGTLAAGTLAAGEFLFDVWPGISLRETIGVLLIAGILFSLAVLPFLAHIYSSLARRERTSMGAPSLRSQEDYLARLEKRLKGLENRFAAREVPPPKCDATRKAIAIACADAHFALVKARQITETIVERVYREKRPGQDAKPLFNMIEDLTTGEAAFPRAIASYLHTVRVVGNMAVHGGGETAAAMSESDVELSLLLTLSLVEWFLVEFLPGEGRGKSQ